MRESQTTALTTVVLTILGLILITVSAQESVLRLDAALRGTVSGFQQAFGAVGRGVAGTFRSVAELQELREDHENLLRELERFRNLESDLIVLEAENRRIRELLDFAARAEQPVVAARVIAREGGALFDSLTINRGTRHGVARDQTVVAYSEGRQGFVGRIETVSGGTAVIMPVFSATSYVSGRLEDSRHEGLIRGSGNRFDNLVMNYVPRGARDRIRYQDLVVTSGLNSLFPPGIPLGRVERVTAPSFEPALTIYVQSAIDFSRLEYVFVLVGTGR